MTRSATELHGRLDAGEGFFSEFDHSESEPREPSTPKKERIASVTLTSEESALVNPKRGTALKRSDSIVEVHLGGRDLSDADQAKEAWTTLTNRIEQTPEPYSPKKQYDLGDALEHARFGLGIVNQHVTKTKIEVLFEIGIRHLAANR